MDSGYIMILNGPNINLTGIRRRDVYGAESYDDMMAYIAGHVACGLKIEQHDSEGGIIDALHRCHFDDECRGVVLNAGAYTHYSYAIADAIEAIAKPVVEVHLSNIAAREEFRARSVIAPMCVGSIAGFGKMGYILAVNALLAHAKED